MDRRSSRNQITQEPKRSPIEPRFLLRKRGNPAGTSPGSPAHSEGSAWENTDTEAPVRKRAKVEKQKPQLKRKRQTQQKKQGQQDSEESSAGNSGTEEPNGKRAKKLVLPVKPLPKRPRAPRVPRVPTKKPAKGTKALIREPAKTTEVPVRKQRAKDQQWAKEPPPRKFERHTPQLTARPPARRRPRPDDPIEYFPQCEEVKWPKPTKKKKKQVTEEEWEWRHNMVREEAEDEEKWRHTTIEYCTQACLLGLLRGDEMDGECSNVKRHAFAWGRHVLRPKIWLHQLKLQLDEYFGQDCMWMRNKQSSRGALFKLTMRSHGYCILAKGAAEEFVPDLLHEARVYEHLKPIQGISVPVYLGNFPLDERYELDNGISIVHMLLVAWGGDPVENDEDAQASPSLQDDIEKTVAEVRQAGIILDDVRMRNVLWNKTNKRPMLVDFERAVFADQDPIQAGSPAGSPIKEWGIEDRLRVRALPWTGGNLDGSMDSLTISEREVHPDIDMTGTV